MNTYKNTAWLYDLDTRDNLTADLPFYVEYAKFLGGEVLDLGCGTGRVSIEIARNGVSVTGVDISEEMLQIFSSKLVIVPKLRRQINIIKESISSFSLNRRFSLIIAPFRTFQSIIDENEIDKMLECVQNHLSSGGSFIVNAFNPRKKLDESWCYGETVQWETESLNKGHVVKKTWGDKIDTKNQIIYPHFAYEVTKNGKTDRFVEDLALKYYYPEQLRKRLESAGFGIYESYGWYDKSPLDENSREIIYVCGKAFE